MNTVTITYTIKYELDLADNYKWLNNKQCYNSKTGRIIKQTMRGGSIGYVINGRFRSLKYLHDHLQKPKISELPF